MSDVNATMARKVADQLYWDSRIDASAIRVDAADGTIILTGTAPNNRMRRLAEKDAHDVVGVRRVENRVALDEAVPTDRQLKATVEHLLADNRDIDAAEIQVSVEQGRVTLNGTVNAYWKKLIADELLTLVDDVYACDNKLAVVPTEKLGDQAIAASIMGALDRNKWIDPAPVTVQVEHGVVTLAGTVPNWAAYRGAVDAAACTVGVTDVINQITYQ